MRVPAKELVLWVILFGLIAIQVYEFLSRDSSAEYVLLIDAGSSGSRIHLYKWLPEDGDRIPIITELRLDKKCDETKKGLSKLGGSDDTDETASRVHDSLALLITCAKLELTDRMANFQKVRLFLMATAGMRLLESREKQRHDDIMKHVRDYLKGAPFDFRRARVIEGREEALYAWIAANYLNGTLGKTTQNGTIGILELGGASAQIAFVPNDSQSEEIQLVGIAGREYRVYARGYDGVGKKEFIDAFKDRSSCNPRNDKGLEISVYDTCRDRIEDHFNKTGSTVFEQLKEPSRPKYDGKYLALSNFYHTPNFFWQKYDRKFSELAIAGGDYCGKAKDEILAENKNTPEKFLSEYCLMAAYIPALLTTGGFGVEDDDGRVILRLEGSEADVEWALGALICSLYDCRSGS